MADCGAGGSALDRASALLSSQANLAAGGGDQHGKALGLAAANLLGHASTTTGGSAGAHHRAAAAALMPAVAPSELVLPPDAEVPNAAVAARHHHAAAAASMVHHPTNWQPPPPQQLIHHQQQQHHHDPASAAFAPQHQHHHHQQHHPMMMMQPQHHHHHEAAAAAAVAAEQQHRMMLGMMQQQQHHLMTLQAMQQQQHAAALMQQQQQQNSAKQSAAGEHSEAEVEGHHGVTEPASIEELASAWAEAQQQDDQHEREEDGDAGHHGITEPASIEELATAWADAQDEYQQVEDAVNLASAFLDNENDDLHQEHPPLPTYEFVNSKAAEEAAAESNNQKPHDWMSDGMSHFEAGDLKEAIRAFEMEIQLNDPDRADAWRMLGQCHAENDQDPMAISCLEQAVDRDPYSSQARLALGVSYVNELQHRQALRHLKAWVSHHPTFAGLELNDEVDVYGGGSANASGPEGAFEEVQRLLLRALDFARASDESGETTASVLESLGVVYNVSRDYEAAVDAFEKAIAQRPEDYQLYNRLGATLANFQQSEKALPAYRKALQIKPKYARAWLNMAISHSNLQNYEQAARCYLQTLSLNPSASHCWSYLRIALSCSEKWDLIPHAVNMDLAAFKDHYDFVMYN